MILGAAVGGATALAAAWFLDGRDDDVTTVTTTTVTATDPAAPDTTATPPPTPETTSAPSPEATSPAATTPDTTIETTTTTTIPEPRVIPITVGVDDGPERIELIALGAEVEITIVNPDLDDEFHLHGYDLGDDLVVPAGETATLRFIADQEGTFELESHVTDDVYVRLVVE